jgi:hypothetical protein
MQTYHILDYDNNKAILTIVTDILNRYGFGNFKRQSYSWGVTTPTNNIREISLFISIGSMTSHTGSPTHFTLTASILSNYGTFKNVNYHAIYNSHGMDCDVIRTDIQPINQLSVILNKELTRFKQLLTERYNYVL